MLLAHAVALTRGRTYLAALADGAVSVDASLAYERTLLYLDAIHGDDVPALGTQGVRHHRAILHQAAAAAVEQLLLAMLDGARALDLPG